MHLQDLKTKTPKELLEFAENLQIENATTMRRQDLLFSVLKRLAEKDEIITGSIEDDVSN